MDLCNIPSLLFVQNSPRILLDCLLLVLQMFVNFPVSIDVANIIFDFFLFFLKNHIKLFLKAVQLFLPLDCFHFPVGVNFLFNLKYCSLVSQFLLFNVQRAGYMFLLTVYYFHQFFCLLLQQPFLLLFSIIQDCCSLVNIRELRFSHISHWLNRFSFFSI